MLASRSALIWEFARILLCARALAQSSSSSACTQRKTANDRARCVRVHHTHTLMASSFAPYTPPWWSIANAPVPVSHMMDCKYDSSHKNVLDITPHDHVRPRARPCVKLYNANMRARVCMRLCVRATKITADFNARTRTRPLDTTSAATRTRAHTHTLLAHSALHTYAVLLLHHLYRGQCVPRARERHTRTRSTDEHTRTHTKKKPRTEQNNLFSALQRRI